MRKAPRMVVKPASAPSSLTKCAVVDTNVPLIANRKSVQASPQCVLNCLEAIESFTSGERILVLDAGWLIVSEYGNKLNQSGQPGVGDAFLKWVLRNHTNPLCCEQVALVPDAMRGFESFPTDARLAGFDPPDRKFIAVSKAHPADAPILQAADTKWWSLRQALHECAVIVEFVCQADMEAARDKLAATST